MRGIARLVQVAGGRHEALVGVVEVDVLLFLREEAVVLHPLKLVRIWHIHVHLHRRVADAAVAGSRVAVVAWRRRKCGEPVAGSSRNGVGCCRAFSLCLLWFCGGPRHMDRPSMIHAFKPMDQEKPGHHSILFIANSPS